MSAVLRKELRYFEIASQYLLVEIGGLGVLEGEEPADHRIKDDTTAPDVGLKTQVLLARDHLGCRVAGRATSRFQLLLRASSVHVTQSKINNFQSLVEVEQKVLRLQVPVTDATLVNVLDTRDQLLIHAAGCLLVQALVRHNVVKELSILAVLHDQEKLTFSFNDFKQLDHVRVTDFLQNLDLSRYPLDVLLVLDPRLLQYLNCHLLVRERMDGQLNLAERALTKRLAEDVVAEAGALRMWI